MRFILYRPDMPENFGAAMRIAACFGTSLEVIEPAAFPLDAKRIRRVAMDYADHVQLVKHTAFQAFDEDRRRAGHRLILMTTRGDRDLHRFSFSPSDAVLLGSESTGVSQDVFDASDYRVRIPIAATTRSLNLHVAAAITLFEALRQTGGLNGNDE